MRRVIVVLCVLLAVLVTARPGIPLWPGGPTASHTAWAAPREYGNATVERIVSVHDGDTFRCDIRGWRAVVGDNMPVRIAGIDTPELRDRRPHVRARARRARAFTETQLREATRVRLRRIRRGKYFRLVADVEVDGRDLGTLLLEAGLAKPYNGTGGRPYGR